MKPFLRKLRTSALALTVIFVIFVITFAGQAKCEVQPSSYYLATVYDKNGEKICSFVPRNYNITVKGEWAIVFDEDNCDRAFSSRFISRIEIKKVIKGEDKSKISEDEIERNNKENEFAPIENEFAPLPKY